MPLTTAATLSATSLSPFWSWMVQVSHLEERRKPGPICLTTSVLGVRMLKGDHPWDADFHMVPGWAAGQRGTQLVLEGSMRHRSAPAQDIDALRMVSGDDGVQGPIITAAYGTS